MERSLLGSALHAHAPSSSTTQLLRGNLCFYRGANPDGLDIDKFANAKRGKFASIAAALDAAKGQTRIRGGHAVDENTTRFDAACQLTRTGDVARPEVAAQPELRIIRQLQSVFCIPRASNCRNRTERLL